MDTKRTYMSSIVESRKAEEFLDCLLKPGTSGEWRAPYSGYTLKDYLDGQGSDPRTVQIYSQYPMGEINKMLEHDGIEPIPYHYENERKQYACMIAVYTAGLQYGSADSLLSLQKCIEAAEGYDFPMEKENGTGGERWVIDTETARFDAEKLAGQIGHELEDFRTNFRMESDGNRKTDAGGQKEEKNMRLHDNRADITDKGVFQQALDDIALAVGTGFRTEEDAKNERVTADAQLENFNFRVRYSTDTGKCTVCAAGLDGRPLWEMHCYQKDWLVERCTEKLEELKVRFREPEKESPAEEAETER